MPKEDPKRLPTPGELLSEEVDRMNGILKRMGSVAEELLDTGRKGDAHLVFKGLGHLAEAANQFQTVVITEMIDKGMAGKKAVRY